MEIHSVFIASERVTIRKDDLPNFSISCQIIICFKEFFFSTYKYIKPGEHNFYDTHGKCADNL